MHAEFVGKRSQSLLFGQQAHLDDGFVEPMAVHLLPNLISLISRQKAVPNEYFADFHKSSPAVGNYWSAVSAIDHETGSRENSEILNSPVRRSLLTG